MRFRKYRQQPKFSWKYYLNKTTLKYAAIAAGGVFFLVLLILLFRGGGVSAKDTALFNAREIIVGVATPSAFASADESGNVSGFERDVAEAALTFVYPNHQFTFIAIDNQEASYLLKTGEIDIAIGMYTEGVLKTQGLALTSAYFQDALCAYVPQENAAQSLYSLSGRTVRAMTSEVKKSLVTSCFAHFHIETNVSACTSYPDGIAEVLAGNAAALIVTRYKMASYGDLTALDDLLGSSTYHMLLWNTNKDAASLLSSALVSLRADGTLSNLMKKWNIEEYAG